VPKGNLQRVMLYTTYLSCYVDVTASNSHWIFFFLTIVDLRSTTPCHVSIVRYFWDIGALHWWCVLLYHGNADNARLNLDCQDNHIY
jgi:hypothetical protein